MLGLSMLDWVVLLIILLSRHSGGRGRASFRIFLAGGSSSRIPGGGLGISAHSRVVSALPVTSPWMADIAGFFTIFLAVVLLAGLLGRTVRACGQRIGLRWFDRLLGAPFGFLRGIVISAVLVFALAAFAPQWGLQQSRIAPFMLVTSRALVWAAPADLRQRFWDGWNLLRTVPEHFPATYDGKSDDKKTN